MAAFTPATHKVVTLPSTSTSLSDALTVDARDVLGRLFSDLGIFQVTFDNIAPSTLDVLWYHIDLKTVKRYDALLGQWSPLTPNQLAMHLIRRAILGGNTENVLETGDLFLFWDVSAAEVKKITRENLMAALGAVRTITTTGGIKGGGTLGADRTLSLDIPGLPNSTQLTLADTVAVYSATDATHEEATLADLASIVTSGITGSTWFFYSKD